MRSIRRRDFLRGAVKAAGAVGFAYVVPSSVLGLDGAVSPSNKITIGCIGTGSHGIEMNVNSFLQQPDARIVAVCDVDDEHLKEGQKAVNEGYGNRDAATYKDWREVIARKDIDAVMISTPDHWHVPMSIAAAKAGKDVQCEKPTLTIAEGQELIKVIREYNTVFQMSTEDRSVYEYHRMAELVRNGRIGKLHTIKVGLPKGYWIHGGYGGVQRPQPVPKGFDYDMWLGPAPWAPYTPGRCHWNFRWIQDYSEGMLSDWGAHLVDTAQWGNDTEHTGPIEIEGRGVFPKNGLYDAATEFNIRYRYANGVTMIVESSEPSIRFEGTDGWVGNVGWRGNLEAEAKEILDSVIGPNEIHLYTCAVGEHRNFLDCVKSRKAPYFPVEIGHRCCSVLHLGSIAMLLGRKLKWYPGREEFAGDDEASRMLGRSMRSPWNL